MWLGELKRYEKYKDSGVEWIGEVPEGWEIFRLKYTLQAGRNGIRIGPFGSSLKLEEMDENFSYKVYGQENLINNDFGIGKRYINIDKFLEMKEYEIFPNDIVISMMGTIGKCKIVPNNITKGIMDSHLVRIRTNNRIVPRFLALLIDESNYVKNQFELESKGSIMSGLNSTIIKELKLILPDVDCQRRILDFLDQKTSEIDSLIADKEKLIELLQEQRQAIISEAVTKGLNQNVKMKDSGIEWIGEVPEGWEVVPLRWLISIRSGDFINKDEINEEGKYPVIGGNGIMAYTDKINIDKPTIAIGRVGALCGNIHLINEKSWITDNALYLTEWQSKKIYLDYLRLFLEALNLNRFASQTAQPLITGELVKKQYIPLPSLEEQINICSYLKNYFTNLDELIQSIRFQISNLKEYRQSLISEAVTGKIMV